MNDRRRFLGLAVIAGSGFALAALPSRAETKRKSKTAPKAAPPPLAATVNPTEDLMREHGILLRMLLIYEEGVRRLEEGSTISVDIFASTLRLNQRFSEGYHQKLEEDHVFSKMEVAGKLTELTRVLRGQHDAERKLTAQLLKNATPSGLGSSERRTALVDGLRSLNRMLRPHTAWEDTVLFPAFHQLLTEREFEKLGEVFEETEHQVLGPAGFQGILGEVVQLERGLGIDKLSSFTVHI